MVVAVVGVKVLETDLVVDQVVQGVLKGPGQQLLRKTNGEKPRAGVDGFVAGHASLRSGNTLSNIDIPFGSRHDAPMKDIFLQRR
jgi:hypothetical protein